MSDEQTIYIGPQDDLTNVRERLERIPARRVTLVIPSQTLLRSLIAWRNLYARAQELGKEVLIISSDPQVRSVAQAAKFKVASLESGPPVNKPRSSGRILRPPLGGRGQTTPSGEVRLPPRGAAEQRNGGSSHVRQSGPSPLREPRPAQQSPESSIVPTDEPSADALSETQLPPAGPSEQHYGQPYDVHFDTSPPIRPLSREQIEEEPDLSLDDVQMSHNIRKVVYEGNKGDVPVDSPEGPSPTPEQVPSAEEPSQPYRVILPSDEADPFADMGDHEPPLVGEQHGSVSIDGFDTNEQHILQAISKLEQTSGTGLIGQQLGSYRLLRFLGQGFMGDTYLAESVQSTHKVAIKLLRDEYEDSNHFQKQAKLKHPNIVQLLGFDIEGKTPFLVRHGSNECDNFSSDELIARWPLTRLEAFFRGC